jgi:hypothetical protein
MMARIAGWDSEDGANRAPVLAHVGDKSTVAGITLAFTLSATDADGDALTFSAPVLPAGADFDPTGRSFTWTPQAADIGRHDAAFRVVDNGSPSMADAEEITITVLDGSAAENHAPEISPLDDQTVAPGQPLSFTLQATDPDGDALEYQANDLPAGATFNEITMTFAWTPGTDDIGDYRVEFIVTDDGTPPMSTTETVVIQVGDISTGPPSKSDSNSGCFLDLIQFSGPPQAYWTSCGSVGLVQK